MLNLSWLIPVFPLLAFAIIVLVTNQDETRATASLKKLSSTIAIGAMAVAWLFSLIVVVIPTLANYLAYSETPGQFPLLEIPTGQASFPYFGVAVDPLTAVMLFMVPFVCLMIFIYARGYMTWPHHLDPSQAYTTQDAVSKELDPRYSRFFAYISLFAAGMLGLVVANNLFMLFVFWELMGLCSYLLISFWFEKKYWNPNQITPKGAGLKAFLTTRIGDTIMFSGMALLFVHAGTLNFDEIFRTPVITHLAETMVPGLGISWAALTAFLIFWGAMGKSSQFPLHVWLPDAMEGPTPVSALIHAATMVSAGVYLIIRMFPLFHAAAEGAPWVLNFVAAIGAFTAIFAATIAVAQNDVKKVLAYSTISQLGYMFAALGIGAYVAATFHLLTHAFFKALLFLGSGAVIHSVEHGEHHVHEAHGGHDSHAPAHDSHATDDHGHDTHADGPPFDPQDMLNMGGLWKRIPRVGWTFLIGGLALSGFPIITAGFWSKDEILANAFELNSLVFWTLALSALLTAFYTGRQICLTFFGQPRSEAAAHASLPTKLEKTGLRMNDLMTWPLMLLAVFAVVGGWVGIPEKFPVLGGLLHNPFEHVIGSLEEALTHALHAPEFNTFPLMISIIAALGGLTLAWLVYGVRPLKAGEVDPVKRLLGPIWTVLNRKYYIDELYMGTVVAFTRWLAEMAFRFDNRWIIDPIVNGVGRLGRLLSDGLRAFFDEPIIDGIVNGVGALTDAFGRIARKLQTGQGQNYLLFAVMTIMLLLGFYLYA